jgi:hypothetical protein
VPGFLVRSVFATATPLVQLKTVESNCGTIVIRESLHEFKNWLLQQVKFSAKFVELYLIFLIYLYVMCIVLVMAFESIYGSGRSNSRVPFYWILPILDGCFLHNCISASKHLNQLITQVWHHDLQQVLWFCVFTKKPFGSLTHCSAFVFMVRHLSWLFNQCSLRPCLESLQQSVAHNFFIWQE